MGARALFGFTAVWASCAHAQSTFEKVYDAGSSFRFNLVELPGQNMLVGLGWARGMSRLDPNGNVIQTHYYWSDTLTAIGGMRKHSDNVYVFAAAYRKDSCSSGAATILNRYPVIGKMDSLGNVLEMRHYALDQGCSNVGGDVLVTANREVVTWGYERSFFALKADSTLAPIWAKRFNHNGGIQFIKELPGGDLLAGINMDTAGAVIARLDPVGNFIWCKSYMRPKGMVHDAVIESDGSFTITGYTDSLMTTNGPLPPNYHPKLFMMKLDGIGNVQWCKGYDSDPYLWYSRQWSRIEAVAGNYVLLATLGQPGYNFFDRPFLMKTTSSGDTLWTRALGASGYSYYSRELLAHSDGGFVISGGVWGALPNGNSGLPYLLKTDSLGHMPCNEQWHSIEVTDLFPTDSSFTLTSIDGAVALPAFVSDTIFDPITVYDGCTITSVIDPRHPRKFKVYPNPTTGQFTVEFEDPLMADSYYSVYDAMGRLLYQRPLPSGATMEQVDLSRYGKGAYVIKLTDREGVRYERVVLE